MQVLLPPERIEIQPMEINNEPKNLDQELTEEPHAAKPHAEHDPKLERSVEDENSDQELTKDLPTLPD